MKTNIQKGFTIVELVIVIAVIAILAAVLIPTFSGLTARAKKNAAMQEAKNAYTAFLTEQGTAIQNHNLIIQQGDFFFTVKDGQLSDTPYETLDGAKALFDTVTSWSDKDEKGFYFPVTEPPVTPPVTDDPLDSVDDPPPPVTPPEPDESWKEKFEGGYEYFLSTTSKADDGERYYAYLNIPSREIGLGLFINAQKFIEEYEIAPADILYGGNADSGHQNSDVVLYATQTQLQEYAKSEHVVSILPYPVDSSIITSDPVRRYQTPLPADEEPGALKNALWNIAKNSGNAADSSQKPILLIQSTEALTSLIELVQSHQPAEESEETFSSFCNQYDNAFFEEKSLLIIYIETYDPTDFEIPFITANTFMIDEMDLNLESNTTYRHFLMVGIDSSELSNITDYSVCIR